MKVGNWQFCCLALATLYPAWHSKISLLPYGRSKYKYHYFSLFNLLHQPLITTPPSYLFNPLVCHRTTITSTQQHFVFNSSTMPSSNQPLVSKDAKPPTYMDIPIINDAVAILDKAHHESDVERAVELILDHYFPYKDGWAKT